LRPLKIQPDLSKYRPTSNQGATKLAKKGGDKDEEEREVGKPNLEWDGAPTDASLLFSIRPHEQSNQYLLRRKVCLPCCLRCAPSNVSFSYHITCSRESERERALKSPSVNQSVPVWAEPIEVDA
jgi:hypothetical protein